jgi:hypothetical protein
VDVRTVSAKKALGLPAPAERLRSWAQVREYSASFIPFVGDAGEFVGEAIKTVVGSAPNRGH